MDINFNFNSNPVHQFSPFTDLQKTKSRSVEADVRRMIAVLDTDEQIKVSFVPLIITQFAWKFAESAISLSAKYHMSDYKKICRNLKESRKEYLNNIHSQLDMIHADKIFSQSDSCLEILNHDLTILYFSVNQGIKNCSPSITHDDVRTYAVISVLFVLFLMKHYREMDNLLKRKLNDKLLAPTEPPEIIRDIFNAMNEISGVEKSFDYGDKNVNLAMDIIQKAIRQIKFDII